MTSTHYILSICFILVLTIAAATWSVIVPRTSASHDEIWAQVLASQDPEQVTLFVGNYPDSPHRTEAVGLLRDLLADQTVTRVAPNLLAVPAELLKPDPNNAASHGLRVSSKTLPQLVGLTPKYPPVSDLPEHLWKGKACKNCHKWTALELCMQAQTYREPHFDPRKENGHPLGVAFKVSLRKWAEDGCF